VRVDVSNSGKREGEEVVQLYASYPQSEIDRPVKELKGFKRIKLKPGQTKTVSMKLRADDLRYWDAAKDQWVLESKPVQIQVGASSADIRQTKALEVGR
jgi:beta-glucosidase